MSVIFVTNSTAQQTISKNTCVYMRTNQSQNVSIVGRISSAEETIGNFVLYGIAMAGKVFVFVNTQCSKRFFDLHRTFSALHWTFT